MKTKDTRQVKKNCDKRDMLTVEDHVVVLDVLPWCVPLRVPVQHHSHGLPRKQIPAQCSRTSTRHSTAESKQLYRLELHFTVAVYPNYTQKCNLGTETCVVLLNTILLQIKSNCYLSHTHG